LRDSCRIDVVPVVVLALLLVVEYRKDQLFKEASKELADAAELVFVPDIPNDISRLVSLDPNLNCELTADRVVVKGLVRYKPCRIGVEPVPIGVLTSHELEGGDDVTLKVQDGVTCSFPCFLSWVSIVIEELSRPRTEARRMIDGIWLRSNWPMRYTSPEIAQTEAHTLMHAQAITPLRAASWPLHRKPLYLVDREMI
jgi:hypothetical protein